MNERIKELAEQCHHGYSEHNIDLAKFAELLINEVIQVIESDYRIAIPVGNAVYKHFGIKDDRT